MNSFTNSIKNLSSELDAIYTHDCQMFYMIYEVIIPEFTFCKR